MFLLLGTGVVLVLFYIYPIVPDAPARTGLVKILAETEFKVMNISVTIPQTAEKEA